MSSSPPAYSSIATPPVPCDDKKYDFSSSKASLPTYHATVTPSATQKPSKASQEQNRIWGANVGKNEIKSTIWGAARQDNHAQGSGFGKNVDERASVPAPWGRGIGGDSASSKWWKKAEQNAEARGPTNVWGAGAHRN